MLPLRQTPGHLAENVVHFARVLRHAGLPVGSDRVQLALQALQVAGLESRTDFHAVLGACLLDRIEHRALFDQAFALFWRDPDLTGRMRALMLPQIHAKPGILPTRENRRLAAALFPNPPAVKPPDLPPDEKFEVQASVSWNDRELLRKTDFETMSAEEWQQARRLLTQMRLVFEPMRTRRSRPSARP
ncbi:MAG: hypothetical protein ABI564_18550, partial [Ideonella sp.]